MGSPCELQLYGADAGHLRTLANLAMAEACRLEKRYSRYRPDSLLSQINRVAAAGGEIRVDEETASLLKRAAPLHDLGKLGIPDTILLKLDRLTDDEFRVMQTHT
ncbi:MAG TPA: FAD:protein FMN transferase, partial [Cellvibrionaceae bacterium]|nr:FAD:protein FMN transferase [Cellvibrionaceae bacterium]